MDHEPFMRAAHAAAIRAGQAGNHPFGAVLVHNGRRILTAENTVNTDEDAMRHAEYNLVLEGVRTLSQDVLRRSILYASTAPCLLCTAAILLAEIPTIVYSVSYDTFGKLVPGEYRYIACEEIVRRLGRTVEVVGPILEREGLRVFQYWGGEQIPLTQILRLVDEAGGSGSRSD
jgi:tRNA(Arg) A34 adenosine deaminase TadA